jgi:hypothetical protein
MCATWKKKPEEYDRGLLVDGLESLRTTDASGQVGFSAWEFLDLPPGTPTLKKKMKMIKGAIRYHK